MSVIPCRALFIFIFFLLTVIPLVSFSLPYLISPLSVSVHPSYILSTLSHTSLQATGPFLHIGALAAVTALSWIVAGQVARTEKTSTFTSADRIQVLQPSVKREHAQEER